MMKIKWILVFACSLLMHSYSTNAQEISYFSGPGYDPGITLNEIEASYFGEADATIIFQEESWDPVFTKEPQFIIQHPESKETAKGWIAVDPYNIHIQVIVKDKYHSNTYEGGDIYKGDAIQIGLDGKGDGSRGSDKTLDGAFGKDDIAFTLALTENAPIGWIHFQGNAQVNRPVEEDYCRVERNEKKGTTTYHLQVEWAMLETEPGLFPDIGIAVMVNDSEEGQAQTRYSYGEGAGGTMKPGLFKRIRLNGFQEEVFGLEVLNKIYWDSQHPVQIMISVNKKEELGLAANYQYRTDSFKLANDGEIHRYLLDLHPGEKDEYGQQFWFNIYDENESILMENNLDVELPDKTVESFISMLDDILKHSENDLFTRHLNSVRSITLSEWARVKLVLPDNQRHALESLEFIRMMHTGFFGESGKWESYRRGDRSMIMSYVSMRDRTIQYYTLTLPKDWQPEKAYPLFVELHGAGNQNPLGGPSSNLGYDEGVSHLMGYSAVKGYAASQGLGYHVEPFGRGNTSYRDIGAIDVWEAFHDVSSNFNIDENRRYLFGFSMGGGGTAHLGMRTPDLWAAMAIYSGSYREKPGVHLGKNVSYLPIWMWCGEKDFLYNNMRSLEKEILEHGNTPVTTWVPGLGHNYRGDGQEAGVKWLQKHTRKRPDQFSFISDDNDYPGTWGITMLRDLSISGLPTFDCKIEGNVVEISSEGCHQIDVEFGENGLQMSGKVKVIWNGKEVYKGDAETIRLDENGARKLKKNYSDYRGSLVRSILEKY